MIFQVIYNLHWTLEDIQKLSMSQLNWIAEALDRQKRKEKAAMRRKR